LPCSDLGGVLVGPPLAAVHWVHGWSPVAILYALSAPMAIVLLASLLIPFVSLSYLAQHRLERAAAGFDPAATKDSLLGPTPTPAVGEAEQSEVG
jgi:hypothetical protein